MNGQLIGTSFIASVHILIFKCCKPSFHTDCRFICNLIVLVKHAIGPLMLVIDRGLAG